MHGGLGAFLGVEKGRTRVIFKNAYAVEKGYAIVIFSNEYQVIDAISNDWNEKFAAQIKNVSVRGDTKGKKWQPKTNSTHSLTVIV